MATVADLSGNFPNSLPAGVDRKLAEPNRNNAGSPVSSLIPQYAGELVLDTTNLQIWQAFGTSSTEWMPVVGVGT